MQIFSFREDAVTGRQDVHTVQDADVLFSREGREGAQ